MTHSLLPDFFICSRSFQNLWNNYVINDYEANQKFVFRLGLDVFKEALISHLGGNPDCVLTCESFDMLKSYLPAVEDIDPRDPSTKYKFIKLIDLINFTDFIDISRILSIF